MIHPNRQTKDLRYITTLPIAGLFLIVAIFLGIPSVAADGVNLSIPQDIYYFPVGMQAALPISIVSTYSHDVTGTLSLMTVQENAASANENIKSLALSAFTDERTIMINVGESDVPADYRVTVIFTYDNGGQHSVVLPQLTVRYVTNPQAPAPDQTPLFGTDTLSSSSGSNPFGTGQLGQGPSNRPNVANNPDAAIINAQIPQDSQAFKSEVEREINQSEKEQDELLGYITTDPLIESLNRSLSAGGFMLEKTDIHPVSNSTGTFSQMYMSGKKTAVIDGSVNETHVMFAEESSHDPVPLPSVLVDNASYQDYLNSVTGNGFTLNQTGINVTLDQETIDLTYSNPDNRMLHASAEIENGSVIAFAGDSPVDPLSYAGPAIALASVLLLSAGIWYFARFREKDLPATVEPERKESPQEAANRLLNEAESDAARDLYPEAYRKTGRAIRIFLSHEIGDGAELTGGELENLIGAHKELTVKIRWVLNRAISVGFAKDAPDPGNFRKWLAVPGRS